MSNYLSVSAKAARSTGLLSIILVVLIIGTCLTSAAQAEDPLTVSIDDTNVVIGGDNPVVKVSLTNVASALPRGINNSKFVIHYDNSVLEIVSVQAGSLITSASDMAVNPGNDEELLANTGEIVLLHNDESVGERSITRDGEYAVLAFRIKSGAQPGEYPITFAREECSIGQLNADATFPEDFDMSGVVFEAGCIKIESPQPEKRLTVLMDNVNATAGGENAVLAVRLANVSSALPRGINNSKFVIRYDNSALGIISVRAGSLIADSGDMAVNPYTSEELAANTGKIVLLHNDESVGERSITGDGEYAVLTFKVKGGAQPGKYDITFAQEECSIGQLNADATLPEDVDMDSVVFQPGAITVQSSPDYCFIATAAYGSKFEPAVVLLRAFRDKYLLSNALGQRLVAFYYKESPPIAAFIAQNEILKALVRVILTPVVGLVYLLFHPVLLYVLIFVTVGLLVALRRRKAGATV